MNNKEVNVKFGGVSEAMSRYSLGRSTVMRVGIDSKAKIKIGKRTLYDFEVMDAYVKSFTER